MADPGEAGKRRKGRRRKRKPSESERQANLLSALNHPLRRRIMRAVREADEPTSPARLREKLGDELSSVSYHVLVLVGLGALGEAGTEPVRGAVEHFYVSLIDEDGADSAIIELLEATEESDEQK